MDKEETYKITINDSKPCTCGAYAEDNGLIKLYKNGVVSPHRWFKLYRIKEGDVISVEVIDG